MNLHRRLLAAAFALAIASPVMAQPKPVTIVGLVELSGAGATAGTNFNNGVKLAVKEINAAGGILGRKIEYTANDTQSKPGVAKALAQKAVDDGAYVVMGPVFSGSFIVSMAETSAPKSRTSPAARRRISRSRAIPTFSARRSRNRRRCPSSPSTSRTPSRRNPWR